MAVPMKAGFYNSSAQLQGNAMVLALPLVEKAAASLPLPRGNNGMACIQIADLGCSQGSNSMQALEIALAGINRRVTKRMAVRVTHEDLPSNDFTSLLRLIHDPKQTYLPHLLPASTPANNEVVEEHSAEMAKLDVYPSCIGQSFYERLFPTQSVHLTLAFSCLHWLRELPLKPVDCVIAHVSKDLEVKSAFLKEFQEGFHMFLKHRAAEAVPGASVVFHIPVDVQPACECMLLMNEVANDMVRDGKLTKVDIGNMCMCALLPPPTGVYEVLNQVVGDWAVDSSETCTVHHPANAEYNKGSITAEEFAVTITETFVAAHEPTVLAGLQPHHSLEESLALTLEFFDRFRHRLVLRPQSLFADFMYVHLVRTAQIH